MRISRFPVVLGILILYVVIACVSASAQTYSYIKQFKTEKVGVFHTIKNGQDLVPGEHYLLFANYTNNNLRVTYKVTVRVISKKARKARDYTYTSTVYVKPNGQSLDFFYDDGNIMNYLNSQGDWFNNCHILFLNFEMINFGVEKKNYETTY